MRIAIIPARGGSKRIPRKNVRPFLGRPILQYSVDAALASGCFDEVMVSTDDQEIADVARAAGARVPFFRSADASDDHATTADVLIEVLNTYADASRTFRDGCCIYPTAPFVTAGDLSAGAAALDADPSLAGVITVTRFSYPIQRALKIMDGRISMMQPEYMNTRSQDLEPAYHDAGQFYWFRVARFLETRSLMAPPTAALVLPEWRVQDIDNEDDWRLAELKLRAREHV